MKYVKTLGLLAVAAAALMAFAGTASATTVTAGGSTYTGAISATAEGHVVLDNPIAKIECGSGVETAALTHGAGVTAKATITKLEFFNCTNSWHVTVVTLGSLEVHAIGTGTGLNGTLTSSGTTVESTRFGVTCRYATSSTDVGTITKGVHGTLDISAAIPFHSGSGLCGGGTTTWTGSYNVTLPTNLSIDS